MNFSDFKAYQNQEGVFSKTDKEGNTNEWWDDAFMTNNAPWEFWAEVPQIKVEHPELYWLANRVLQIGVASSCNERYVP